MAKYLFGLSCPDSLCFISRNDWEANTPKGDFELQNIRFITIHHSGIFYSETEDTKIYLRNLQEWCKRKHDWEDIPYHYMIDPEGIMYECRKAEYMGDTATEYNPKGHLLITLLGNFEEQEVSHKQIDALATAIAWSARLYKIPIDSDHIKSHKDFVDTLCPGANLYKYFADGTLLHLVREKFQELYDSDV